MTVVLCPPSRTVATSALLPDTAAVVRLRYEDGEHEYGNRVARRPHRALTEPAGYEARGTVATEMGWWRS
jgi:hypothetical protein